MKNAPEGSVLKRERRIEAGGIGLYQREIDSRLSTEFNDPGDEGMNAWPCEPQDTDILRSMRGQSIGYRRQAGRGGYFGEIPVFHAGTAEIRGSEERVVFQVWLESLDWPIVWMTVMKGL